MVRSSSSCKIIWTRQQSSNRKVFYIRFGNRWRFWRGFRSRRPCCHPHSTERRWWHCRPPDRRPTLLPTTTGRSTRTWRPATSRRHRRRRRTTSQPAEKEPLVQACERRRRPPSWPSRPSSAVGDKVVRIPAWNRFARDGNQSNVATSILILSHFFTSHFHYVSPRDVEAKHEDCFSPTWRR